jgi:nitroimidazol reductase NimA-like FMN-containing flavoprotein (pyridoxamine 5'-phosphate oxidase superfamily)
MRRKDREMSAEFGLSVIDRAQFGVLSLVNMENEVYSLPLSIARDGDRLYFHSATAGLKTELLEDGKKVRVVFVSDVRVPDLLDEQTLEEIVQEGQELSTLGSKVFTTEYSSAIVSGRVSKLREDQQKLHGLRIISEKFVPAKMAFFEAAASASLDITDVYWIEIESITAKRKKFDQQGQEMKFQRME